MSMTYMANMMVMASMMSMKRIMVKRAKSYLNRALLRIKKHEHVHVTTNFYP